MVVVHTNQQPWRFHSELMRYHLVYVINDIGSWVDKVAVNALEHEYDLVVMNCDNLQPIQLESIRNMVVKWDNEPSRILFVPRTNQLERYAKSIGGFIDGSLQPSIDSCYVATSNKGCVLSCAVS